MAQEQKNTFDSGYPSFPSPSLHLVSLHRVSFHSPPSFPSLPPWQGFSASPAPPLISPFPPAQLSHALGIPHLGGHAQKVSPPPSPTCAAAAAARFLLPLLSSGHTQLKITDSSVGESERESTAGGESFWAVEGCCLLHISHTHPPTPIGRSRAVGCMRASPHTHLHSSPAV